MTTDTNDVPSAGFWTTFRESPSAVKAILLGVFVNRLGGLLTIFLVLFFTAKGYSNGQAALALGLYGGGAVVGLLIGGALADRLGVRNATLISMIGSSVLIVSLLYLPSYPLLLAAVVVVSLVQQIYRPASSTLVSELTPPSRQVMIFALYRFALNLGTTAAPLIGFALYRLNDQHYTALFWADAIVAVVYALLALLALPARTPRTPDPAAAATKETPGYRAMLADRRYLLYLVATFFNAVVYVQYLSTLPLDVHAAGLEIFWYTLAVSLNGLVVIGFELPLTKFTQTWPMRISIPFAIILGGVGVAFYGFPLVPAVIIIGTLIWTIAELIGGPATFAYPGMAGPAHLKGRYIGSFQFAFGLGTACGPVIGSVLFALLGHGVWLVVALGSVIAAVCGLAAIPRPPTSAPATAAPVASTGSA